MAAKSLHFHLKMDEALDKCRADCHWERQLAMVGQMRGRAAAAAAAAGASPRHRKGAAKGAAPEESGE